MSNRILVLYGSYRSDRMGIRLAQFVIEGFRARGDDVEFIDAKAIGLPMLDKRLKEFAEGTAPAAMAELGAKIRPPMRSCSSRANTTGASSPGSRT